LCKFGLYPLWFVKFCHKDIISGLGLQLIYPLGMFSLQPMVLVTDLFRK
jgi:hypothetical protein